MVWRVLSLTLKRHSKAQALFTTLYRLVGDRVECGRAGRRGLFHPAPLRAAQQGDLKYHGNVLLHPKVKAGAISRDSLIVAGFHPDARGIALSGRVGQRCDTAA